MNFRKIVAVKGLVDKIIAKAKASKNKRSGPNILRHLRQVGIELPVTLSGRLAVDARLNGQGRGAFLLMDALRQCFKNAVNVAAVAVVVDAKDDAAAAFYWHFCFLALQRDPRCLYLPIKTVATLFSSEGDTRFAVGRYQAPVTCALSGQSANLPMVFRGRETPNS